MSKVDKYTKLTSDLRAAFEETLGVEETDDGGSMCCDVPVLFLNRWSESKVRQAVLNAGGLGVVKLEDWTRFFQKTAYSVIFHTTGRADRRSRRAAAIATAMKCKGYEVSTYESMD